MTKQLGAGLVLGVIGTVLIAVAVWLTVAYTGAYNVAASDQHADAIRWTLDTTMHRSVERRAGDVELPETFSDELVAQGAGHYAESCVYCHGAPGQDPTEWSRGMRPEPPHLTEAASEWSAEEIYWIVENGIKMSGMPAFGGHHGPEGVTAITAFVTRLPGLSPEDYRALTGGGAAAAGGAAIAPAD
ncbi:c-type cytochrome [Roseitranquillus sediminis]|uniref:c-type cytochrome n=1 Tax=Roseitranquillus sediminis TaxID=2809051 RepID=UPI001D0C15C2|nr:cytochrome c [Roseitranquillus sediminis]MBM9593409.1 cytochrome c [Roseitranquillus sediminis]